MKYALLLFVITCACTARASDTLTRAQIYNFNVGDTFDYKSFQSSCLIGNNINECYPLSPATFEYTRYVIQDMYYSADADTLFIVRQQAFPLPMVHDTLVLDSLSFPEIYLDSSCSPSGYIVDSSSAYHGRIINGVSLCFGIDEVGGNIIFGAGLGKVFSDTAGGDPDYGKYNDSIKLVYYSKGSEKWGTPYYVLNQSALIHYTPIPEECVIWLRTVDSMYDSLYDSIVMAAYVGNLAFQEKITSGNKISYQGHTYVEMLYSWFDAQANTISPDTVIGYYRNDTLNRKAYLYSSLNSAPFVYDFTLAAGDNGGEVTSLSQTIVGGQVRTVWNLNNGNAYIEGVGGASTIWPVRSYSFIPPYNPFPQTVYGSLCFSVCGQTLYPYDSTANCSLAAINNIAPIALQVKVYPTLNNGLFTVELTDQSLQNVQLLVTDITGREIKRCALNSQLNNISIQPCATGMYIWQVLSGDKLFQAGKIIKE